jgi:hypothetical protein
MRFKFHPISYRQWIIGVAVIGILILLYTLFGPSTKQLETLTIISRAEWGAEQADPNLQSQQDPEVFNTVVIHHSAMPPFEGPREIQYVHMHQRAFLDIGYHFVIDQKGRVYEGRSLSTHGAHVKNHNAGTLGIALMGNYELLEPLPEQLEQLKRLIQSLMLKYPLTHLAGHQDFLPGHTLCPGKNLEPLLPVLASQLDMKFGTQGYVGPEPAATTPNTPSTTAETPVGTGDRRDPL